MFPKDSVILKSRDSSSDESESGLVSDVDTWDELAESEQILCEATLGCSDQVISVLWKFGEIKVMKILSVYVDVKF